jgi:hypothetical protein
LNRKTLDFAKHLKSKLNKHGHWKIKEVRLTTTGACENGGEKCNVIDVGEGMAVFLHGRQLWTLKLSMM